MKNVKPVPSNVVIVPRLPPWRAILDGCCDKAVAINCVCYAAHKCPVHGERHVGTHD
jgi:hypothetical protein